MSKFWYLPDKLNFVFLQKYPQYTLEIAAADMEGRGLSGITKVILKVTDSNDNAPVFNEPMVSASHLWQ